MTVAFALSGGGNLGPLQAGAVLALVESGIEPDLLVGSSVGALNAAFVATRPRLLGAQQLVESWSALRRREALQLNPARVLAGFLGARDHLLSSSPLRRLIRRWICVDQLEETNVPLAVTTTDALTGECVVLRSGAIVEALVASAAIPGLFPAVRLGGRWLVDGSLAASQPARQAQDLGANEVYVLTTATAPRMRPPRGAVAMAMNSVSLVTTRLAQADLAEAMRHATASGGQVFVVPSAEPDAPSPLRLRTRSGTGRSRVSAHLRMARPGSLLERRGGGHPRPWTGPVLGAGHDVASEGLGARPAREGRTRSPAPGAERPRLDACRIRVSVERPPRPDLDGPADQAERVDGPCSPSPDQRPPVR